MHSFHEHELKDLSDLVIYNDPTKVETHRDKRTMNFVRASAKEFFCNICYQHTPIYNIVFIKCKHYFCKACFAEYFEFIIKKTGQV